MVDSSHDFGSAEEGGGWGDDDGEEGGVAERVEDDEGLKISASSWSRLQLSRAIPKRNPIRQQESTSREATINLSRTTIAGLRINTRKFPKSPKAGILQNSRESLIEIGYEMD